MPKGTQMMMRGLTSVRRDVGPRDEVAQHRLGDLEVGDDAVAQRANCADVPGRAAEHLFGLAADGEDLVAPARVLLDGDDRGLARDDALALHVDEGVRRAEIDREIVREQAVKPVEDHGVGVLGLHGGLALRLQRRGGYRFYHRRTGCLPGGREWPRARRADAGPRCGGAASTQTRAGPTPRNDAAQPFEILPLCAGSASGTRGRTS